MSGKLLYTVIAGICSALLGFGFDFLSYRLLVPWPEHMGSMHSESYELLLSAQAQTRADACSHLGIALMLFGFILIAMTVYSGLQAAPRAIKD